MQLAPPPRSSGLLRRPFLGPAYAVVVLIVPDRFPPKLVPDLGAPIYYVPKDFLFRRVGGSPKLMIPLVTCISCPSLNLLLTFHVVFVVNMYTAPRLSNVSLRPLLFFATIQYFDSCSEALAFSASFAAEESVH